MIGDNPVNDIRGAREKIDAVTLQKIHRGVEEGVNLARPDAVFREFNSLKALFSKLACA